MPQSETGPMDLAVWLYDKGILSSGAAELFGIPETVLMYRMGYLGEGPTFDLPPHEWAHDVVTTLRLAINDISNTVINRDPEIMSGTPVFMGSRVTVSTLIDHMLDGCSHCLNSFATEAKLLPHLNVTNMRNRLWVEESVERPKQNCCGCCEIGTRGLQSQTRRRFLMSLSRCQVSTGNMRFGY